LDVSYSFRKKDFQQVVVNFLCNCVAVVIANNNTVVEGIIDIVVKTAVLFAVFIVNITVVEGIIFIVPYTAVVVAVVIVNITVA
jgi:hypothetical protein